MTDDTALEAAIMRAACDSDSEAASRLGIARSTFQNRMRRAAERGLVAPGVETMPGYRIDALTTTPNGTYIKQRKEHGEEYTPTLPVKGKTTLVDAEGRIITQHIMERATAEQQADTLRAMVDAVKEEIPRLTPTAAPAIDYADLANQFTVTDNHFGMLAWWEEAGADYDLRIAEQLLLDWFAAEITQSPRGHTAIMAQLGDLMHHDALESVTPAHKHVLDADSRLQKIIRVVIRTIRRVISMLLDTHQHVHVVMASGNHDPASSAWLREMLAVMYERETRISVDSSPALYYAFEWGETALFYHHGHKRGLGDVDRVFASMFREMYGRCRFHFGHIGHKHSDARSPSNTLFPIEQHETLAGKDAYAAAGGFMSGRSAKRITYHKRFGEVGRSTLRPEMVFGASKLVAANDNNERRAVA
ncbi:oxidoreductase [Aquamicrobium soli]|uniref:Oxidoreductase n=1 Tax=Aquamicrobium soli TaxID=1811518 RepID=A0ABV7K995_9HYPH